MNQVTENTKIDWDIVTHSPVIFSVCHFAVLIKQSPKFTEISFMKYLTNNLFPFNLREKKMAITVLEKDRGGLRRYGHDCIFN